MESSDNTDRTSPTTRHEENEEVVAVCCGCWGGSSRNKKKGRRRTRKKGDMMSDGGESIYYDAENGSKITSFESVQSQYYFDAVQEELAVDEYPIVITTYVKPKPFVTMREPETLLLPVGQRDRIDAGSSDGGKSSKNSIIQRQESSPYPQTKRASRRFQQILRRSTLDQKQALEKPRVRIPLRGYPGELTVDELAQCQRFVHELRIRDQAVSEQVYSFRSIEEEPYSICRFLRATKFDADKMLDRLEENKGIWLNAKKNAFYPDVGKAIGAPFSVFLTQYPFVSIGRGRNGCPVNYFQAGKIQPEGIMCLTTVERTEAYFWHSFIYKFMDEMRSAQKADPNFVRCEGINIIDLKGLSRSSLSSETFDVIKVASKVSDFFPETLHCMLVLNAPGFFSMSWGLIKQFIDPRTAQRIQVFSSEQKGQKRLNELIPPAAIPSDYGGLGKSIARALLDQSSNKGVKRQDHELIFIKKRSKSKCSFDVNNGERLTIRVYTRSSSGAKVTVYRDSNGGEQETADHQAFLGEKIREVNVHAQFPCNAYGSSFLGVHDNESCGSFAAAAASSTNNKSRGGGGGHHHGEHKYECLPKCTLVASDIRGPGKFVVEGYDLDDIPKKYSSQPRGYFLVVCDVL